MTSCATARNAPSWRDAPRIMMPPAVLALAEEWLRQSRAARRQRASKTENTPGPQKEE